MKGSRSARVRYFYEYAFADSINNFNEHTADNYITISEARKLRDRIIEQIPDRNLTSLSMIDFQRLMNDVQINIVSEYQFIYSLITIYSAKQHLLM